VTLNIIFNSFLSTSGTRCITLAINPVISHEWWSDRIVITTDGAQIFVTVHQVMVSTVKHWRNPYVIAKCLLSCDVFLMLIRSRQYTVLFPLKYWIELNDIFLSGTFYSQLMRYSRTCGSYLDFRDRRLLPTRTIMKNIKNTSQDKRHLAIT
jgi:hypothetical protein